MYIPPAKLAAMLKDVNDPNTKEYQRMTWEALKKSINGLINKINTSNIKNLVPELFGENLIRGRGLFARSSMKAQAAAPIFTSVYAAMIAVINTKIPANGELVLVRLIVTSCSLLCFAFIKNKICDRVHRPNSGKPTDATTRPSACRRRLFWPISSTSVLSTRLSRSRSLHSCSSGKTVFLFGC